MTVTDSQQKVRLDKWLWAARFFKTRSQAAKAVNGGQVHVNNARCKPAKFVIPGEMIRIHRGQVEFTVQVLVLSGKRGPAPQARLLYEETEESILLREKAREERKLFGSVNAPDRRPGKRDRRLIRKFTRKDS